MIGLGSDKKDEVKKCMKEICYIFMGFYLFSMVASFHFDSQCHPMI